MDDATASPRRQRRPARPAVGGFLLVCCVGLFALTGCTGSTSATARFTTGATDADSSGATASGSPSIATAPTAAVASTNSDATAPPKTSQTSTVAPTQSSAASTSPAPSTVAASPAAVLITYSAWDKASQTAQVSAIVQNVITDSGTCTLTLSLGATNVHVTKAAAADASTTECGTMAIPRVQLAAGKWTAVVSFNSPNHSGSSAAVQIEVAP
jgi:hypothetical protein